MRKKKLKITDEDCMEIGPSNERCLGLVKVKSWLQILQCTTRKMLHLQLSMSYNSEYNSEYIPFHTKETRTQTSCTKRGQHRRHRDSIYVYVLLSRIRPVVHMLIRCVSVSKHEVGRRFDFLLCIMMFVGVFLQNKRSSVHPDWGK